MFEYFAFRAPLLSLRPAYLSPFALWLAFPTSVSGRYSTDFFADEPNTEYLILDSTVVRASPPAKPIGLGGFLHLPTVFQDTIYSSRGATHNRNPLLTLRSSGWLRLRKAQRVTLSL
jgi:hypothetical protein